MTARIDTEGAELPALMKFGPEIWTADGPVVTAAGGFHYPTRAVVIRLSNGGIFVYSPIALTNGLRAAVDALGDVQYLIAPNSLHHMFIAEWKEAYPRARTYAAPGLRDKRKDLAFDGDLGEAPFPAWSGDIDQVIIQGNLITSEVVFFHHASRTAVFTDLIQQLPADWFAGWRAIVAKWDLMIGREPSVPRKFRVTFTNRRVARDAVKRILAWPTDKVLMAHGKPVIEDGRVFLRRAFKWLVP